MMRRISLISLIFLTTTGLVSPALAMDDVALRTGAHEAYARAVFDWPSTVSYTIDRSDKTKLIISFNRGARLDAGAAIADPVPNIAGVTVTAQEPLKVTLDIPEQSKVRDMVVGSRVIIDVYNPPGGAQKTAELKVSQGQAAPAAKEETKAEPKKEQAPPAEKATEKTAEKTETNPEEAKVVEQPKEPETIKLKAKVAPTLISLSSTQTFGLAAFEKDGRLFIANDKSDLLLEPQASGPQAGDLKPAVDIKADQGKVESLPLPPGNILLGQGGGLVWRVLVSPDLERAEPVSPTREGVKKEEVRSGKLIWPLESARSVVNITDPVTGERIIAVTVENADKLAGPERSFVDFDVLDSAIGLALVPRVDDLEVKVVKGNVEISRPGGLSLVDESLITSQAPALPQPKSGTSSQRVYDFKSWQLGGLKAMADNRTILLGGLKDLSEGGKVESLLTLGKMYVSNGMGPEALGVLRFASTEMPSITSSPEFLALRGAANEITQDSEAAFRDLSVEALKQFEEIGYWRAAALADLGDWAQAAEIMPKQVGAVADYPAELQNRLGLTLAEIALRNGNVKLGEQFLSMVEGNEKYLREPQRAALDYLKGEAARQEGKLDETKKLWEPLTTGPDDLYRAKAGLALTRLKVDQKELTPGKAIDSLERLRYAWRGDELEAQINSWLGRTYFESGDYIKGLKIMREATTFVPGTGLAQRIAGDMSDLFSNLYTSDQLEKVSPLDAVALYNQFTELVPLDERGDKIIESLAEHLAKSDLFGRSADLLNFQLQHRLTGEKAYTTAERLAAIRLLDGEPDKAIAALNLAQQKFGELPEEMQTTARKRKLSLLRARALSKQGHPEKAIALLNDMETVPEVNALRADIAWKAGYWDDAAEALGDVILDKNISLTRPLNDANTSLILQRAIALNLASDRIALAQMREKYSDLMNQTDKGKIYEVITRPRQAGTLADRDTLLGVTGEVDLFTDFLNSYKSMKDPVN